MRLTPLLAVLGTVMSADYSKLYDKSGADWPEKYPNCGKPGQSPIDLKSTFKKVYINNDLQMSNYEKGWNDAFFEWDAKFAVQYQAEKTGNDYSVNENMAMSSQYGAQLGFSTMWNPFQIHFHSPSEHTIDGQQYLAELHMVHVAATTANAAERQAAPYAAIGVIFDCRAGYYDEETKTNTKLAGAVNEFFKHVESVNWGGKVNFAGKFSDFIRFINWEERWAYTGSLTTPTCLASGTGFTDSHIFFNVYRKVVYAECKHIQWLKDKMYEKEPKFFSTDVNAKATQTWEGNHRIIQALDTQNPVIITHGTDPVPAKDPYLTAFIVLCLLFVFALIGFIVVCTMICKAQQNKRESEQVGVEITETK